MATFKRFPFYLWVSFPTLFRILFTVVPPVMFVSFYKKLTKKVKRRGKIVLFPTDIFFENVSSGQRVEEIRRTRRSISLRVGRCLRRKCRRVRGQGTRIRS